MKYRLNTVAGLVLVGSVTGILLVASGWTPAFAPPAPAARTEAYGAERAYLSLGGGAPELLASFEGGGAYAEVIQETLGQEAVVRKHVGPPRYEDLVVEFHPGACKTAMQWVEQCWAANPERKDGKISLVTMAGASAGEREFFHGTVTDTTFPACDASSKERGTITVKITPETVRETAAKGSAPKTGDLKSPGKAWSPAYFALQIDGLDCSKVARIEAFTVKRAASREDVGDARDAVLQPGKVEFPDLKITLSAANAQTWKDWFDSFVVKGENDDAKEKTGSLTLLSTDRKTPLMKINFHNLGIRRLADSPRVPGADSARTLRAELYCERMDIE